MGGVFFLLQHSGREQLDDSLCPDRSPECELHTGLYLIVFFDCHCWPLFYTDNLGTIAVQCIMAVDIGIVINQHVYFQIL